MVLVYAFVSFFGLMQGARGPSVVASLGSCGSGLLYEVTGSYTVSFMLAICGAIIGLASSWVVKSLREEDGNELPPSHRIASLKLMRAGYQLCGIALS